MIPFLESITVAQAALLAAAGQALLTLYYVTNSLPELGGHTPIWNLLSVVLGEMVPSAVWTGFFLIVYRECSRISIPISLRTAVSITLIFGTGLQLTFFMIPAEMAMLYWTPLGLARRGVGWLVVLVWAAFLIAFARAHGRPRTRQLALLLAILMTPSALNSAYDAWNNAIGFVLNDMPRQALWRALIAPAIRTIYSLSQILFLWTVWGKPETPVSTGASPAQFAR